jgi:predicted Rossmann fold flavoprotein
MTTTHCDVLFLGAGAAGLMCAIEAGRRGRRVLLLERNNEPGRKILISGGGRCNFTNLHCRPENFLSSNPHFAKSALARYTPADFIAKVETHGIRYHEKTLGQLFCDRSARDILEMLLKECRQAGAKLITGCEIREAACERPFEVQTNLGTFVASSLVIATGGLSIPKIGATDLGYRIARQFGLAIVPCRPALVPLTFGPQDKSRYCDLAGISFEVTATAGGSAFREKMLITHRSLSGPAILQVSSYWRPGERVVIDLLPGCELDPASAREFLSRQWPHRFLQRWIQLNGLPKHPVEVHEWKVQPHGTEGLGKAEVTAGGVDTREISSKTMEAARVPGLYFIGEVLDVTGHLGGFNFQWAWSSGHAAGQAV